MKLEMNEIRDLIDVFISSELGEMEIESHGTRVRLSRNAAPAPVVAVAPPVNTIDIPVNAAGSGTAGTAGAAENGGSIPAKGSSGAPEAEGITVKAPIAGVFYRSSSPGKKPFVREGDKVKKGDVIGLMEAMKLMNEIVAPADGIITEIIAENAKFCEYNEPIIRMADE